jgi:hypothetical protein
MKDERIQTTVNRFAARGFYIWHLLLAISLFYRSLILKQHPRDWWDILAIWVIGILFVFIACVSKGVFAHLNFKRLWLTSGIGVIIFNITLFFIIGQIHSVIHVGLFLIALLLGMGPVIGISHFLNRRWKRKEGIEDEK